MSPFRRWRDVLHRRPESGLREVKLVTTIERFEDVEAWKKGRELAAAVYRL